jgi:hypothetical protein
MASIFFATALFFSACGGGGPTPQEGDFIYRGHDFGPVRNSVYRQGVMDGCKTVDGDYTKNHGLFNDSIDYHDGWEHGRLHCKSK